MKRAKQQPPDYQYNLCSSGYYSDRGAQHQTVINDSVAGTSIAVDAAATIYAAATVDAAAAAAAYFNAADDPEEQQRINDDITAS
jgi:hypothetical protein